MATPVMIPGKTNLGQAADVMAGWEPERSGFAPPQHPLSDRSSVLNHLVKHG